MKLIKKFFLNKNISAGSCYIIGNLFNKAIVFMTIPIFTRLMSTTEYGIVNTYLSWVSIMTLIVGLSLNSSIRSACVDFKDSLDEYIFSIVIFALINFILVSIVVLILSYLFLESLDIILVIMCLIQALMTFIINCISTRYMMEFEYLKRTFLLAVPNILVTFSSVIMLINLNKNKYYGRIISYVFVLSLFGLYFIFKYFKKNKMIFSFNKKYVFHALKLSLPLIFHGLSINILATSDRTMITVFRSASETGIYSLVYSLSMIATVFTTSLESVWIPWFTKKMQSNDKEAINSMAKNYLELTVVIMTVLLFISPEILKIMTPKMYWYGVTYLPPILLASFFIFLYSISVNLEYYYKSTKVIASNTIICAVINLTLNFLFIPKFGGLAAAYTTVIAYVIAFCIHYVSARRLDSDLFHLSIYAKPLILMIVSVVIAYILMDYHYVRWGAAVIILIIYTSLLLNKWKLKIYS